MNEEKEFNAEIDSDQDEFEGASSPPEPDGFEEPSDDGGEASEPEGEAPQEKKKGASDRIRELVHQRNSWREVAMQGGKQAQPEPMPPPQTDQTKPRPELDNFETFEEYNLELHKWNREEAKRELRVELQQMHYEQTVGDFNRKGETKYADYVEKVGSIPISNTTAKVLVSLGDLGVDLAYHLGKNPEMAQRIYRMPTEMQAMELGRLEAQLKPPPQRNKTNAPKPTSPVGGKEIPSKKLEDMDYEEFKAFREKQMYGR